MGHLTHRPKEVAGAFWVYSMGGTTVGAQINLYAGWTGILLGFLAGVVPGLFFWQEGWLGGYGSWRRRLVRLAHVSFFGLGFINIGFGLTAQGSGFAGAGLPFALASGLLVAGALTMPAVCYLAAWRQPLRNLFPVPVLCLVAGVGTFLVWGALS